MANNPKTLRIWFVLHFLIDVCIAIPLFLSPEYSLGLLGWEPIDPIATRLVAAALFGIGIESFLGRNAPAESLSELLNLKIIWSGMAVIAFLIPLVSQNTSNSIQLISLLLIFLFFHGVWQYWKWKLKSY